MTAFIIIATILGIQILFWLLWLLAFSGDERKVSSQLVRPPVSVIVCAHDEEHNLRALIPLLLAQDYPDFEVIIVEDRSNDTSYDFLLDAVGRDPRLRMVHVDKTPDHISGKKFAITLGIKAARHEWVLFTDADCRPVSNTWIQQMASHVDDEKQIVLGYSPYFKTAGALNAFIRFEALITAVQYIGSALLGKPYMGVGRNLAYRKSLFLSVKGFNGYQDVTGGDDDLFVNRHAHKKNVVVALGAASLMRSAPKTTWRDYYYQKLRHLSVGKRYAWVDRLFLGTFTLSWMATWVVALPLSAFAGSHGYWVAALFLLRWITLTSAVLQATRKLGEPFEAWKVPFLDFIYPFYYLVAGTAASLSKKVRWKKN